jgi:hypothetical protein
MIQNCLAKTTFEDGYVLQLGNEQGWQLVPTEGVRLEVEELAMRAQWVPQSVFH